MSAINNLNPAQTGELTSPFDNIMEGPLGVGYLHSDSPEGQSLARFRRYKNAHAIAKGTLSTEDAIAGLSDVTNSVKVPGYTL